MYGLHKKKDMLNEQMNGREDNNIIETTQELEYIYIYFI